MASPPRRTLIESMIAANKRDIKEYGKYLAVAQIDSTPQAGFTAHDVNTMCEIMRASTLATLAINCYYQLVLDTVDNRLPVTETHTNNFFKAVRHFNAAIFLFNSIDERAARQRGRARRAAYKSVTACMHDAKQRLKIMYVDMYVMCMNMALGRDYADWKHYEITPVDNDPF